MSLDTYLNISDADVNELSHMGVGISSENPFFEKTLKDKEEIDIVHLNDPTVTEEIEDTDIDLDDFDLD